MDYEHGGRQKEFYPQEELKNVSCLLCQSEQRRHIHSERGALGIVRCVDCGLIYVSPRLRHPEQIYWGDADKYIKEARLILQGRARHYRDPNYIADLNLIQRYKPTGSFLDIGTNMGFFLRNAKGRGWRLYGVEPSVALSEMARKYFSLNVKTAFLENAGFENNFFDVVTMTDVFEHIAQPGEMLKETFRILKDDGILFIKVPNGLFNLFKFYCARMTGRLKNYDIFDSYEHLIHYSPKTLKAMLQRHGFKIVRLGIGRPIQIPVWHKYLGQYYQYPSPWAFDYKRQSARILLYLLSLFEYRVKLNNIGYLAPNIVAIAKKVR